MGIMSSSVLLFTVISATTLIFLQAAAVDQDLFDAESALLGSTPITSGFVRVDNDVMRIVKRINLPSSCLTMEFINIPANTSSPLGSRAPFKLMTENLYNGRFAWTNGVDYISFSKVSDAAATFGTWLVTSIPGQESGYGFTKPLQETIIPTGLSANWMWLENSKWSQSTAQLVCRDILPKTEHFYQIEYFTDLKAHTGFYTPRLFSSDALDAMIAADEIQDAKLLRSLTMPSYWNDARRDIVTPGSGVDHAIIAKFGSGTAIVHDSGRKTVGHLIQQEHNGKGGWTIAFRREVGSNSEEKKSKWLGEQEVIVSLDISVALLGKMVPLTTAQEVVHMAYAKKSMSSVKRGDYLSVWYRKPSTLQSLVSQSVLIDGSIIPSIDIGVYVRPSIVEEEMGILLECVGRTSTRIIFKYYVSDRRAAMKQTLISKDMEHFIYDVPHKNAPPALMTMTDEAGSKIEITSYSFIGNDVPGHIKKYIDYKSTRMGDLSPCYFYHAAVTLPQPLVYAAEIICVLIGAKPVTLIQYTTPTDHQWKLPFVTELSRGVVRTKLLLGDDFDVEFAKYKYLQDESLVIYRTNRAYVADSLIPYNASQALHPLPYPGIVNPKPDWEAQIYNAWWNGYMLGYPERFVESYCEAFHNGLPLEEKLVQMKRAKVNAVEYLRTIDRPVAEIRLGLEPPISDAAWKSVMTLF